MGEAVMAQRYPEAWSGGAKEYFFTEVLATSPGIGTLGGFNWNLA